MKEDGYSATPPAFYTDLSSWIIFLSISLATASSLIFLILYSVLYYINESKTYYYFYLYKFCSASFFFMASQSCNLAKIDHSSILSGQMLIFLGLPLIFVLDPIRAEFSGTPLASSQILEFLDYLELLRSSYLVIT